MESLREEHHNLLTVIEHGFAFSVERKETLFVLGLEIRAPL